MITHNLIEIGQILQSVPKKWYPCFNGDNFRKCTPILTIFALLQQEMYDA